MISKERIDAILYIPLIFNYIPWYESWSYFNVFVPYIWRTYIRYLYSIIYESWYNYLRYQWNGVMLDLLVWDQDLIQLTSLWICEKIRGLPLNVLKRIDAIKTYIRCIKSCYISMICEYKQPLDSSHFWGPEKRKKRRRLWLSFLRLLITTMAAAALSFKNVWSEIKLSSPKTFLFLPPPFDNDNNRDWSNSGFILLRMALSYNPILSSGIRSQNPLTAA